MGDQTDILWKAEAIRNAYGRSPKIMDRVKKMSDSQIVAVYLRLQRDNKV